MNLKGTVFMSGATECFPKLPRTWEVHLNSSEDTVLHPCTLPRHITKMVHFESMDCKSNTLQDHTTHGLRQSKTQLCHVDDIVIVAVLV